MQLKNLIIDCVNIAYKNESCDIKKHMAISCFMGCGVLIKYLNQIDKNQLKIEIKRFKNEIDFIAESEFNFLQEFGEKDSNG